MTKKIITVFGATGAQGGGLARAILADAKSEFAVHAVTRKAGLGRRPRHWPPPAPRSSSRISTMQPACSAR